MGPYHPETQMQFGSFEQAGAALGHLGLNEDNGGYYGLVVPTVAERPAITSRQRATKDKVPRREGGAWVYGWTVEDIPDSEMRADMPPLSSYQFAMALALGGVISEADAEAWAVEGALPTSALNAINNNPTLTDAEKLGARIKARQAKQIHRVSPIIDMLQAEWQLTDEQVDALFVAGGNIPE